MKYDFEKISKIMEIFEKSLFDKDSLLTFYYSDLENLREAGVEVDNIDKYAYIVEELFENFVTEYQNTIYLDTYPAKMKYQIDAKYNKFNAEHIFDIWPEKFKESDFLAEGYISESFAQKLWFVFEHSDGIDYIFKNREMIFDYLNTTKDVFENMLEGLVELNYENIIFDNLDKEKIYKTIPILKEKFKNKNFDFNDNEIYVLNLIKTLSCDVKFNINPEMNISQELLDNVKNEIHQFIFNFIQKETFTFKEELKFCRELSLLKKITYESKNIINKKAKI